MFAIVALISLLGFSACQPIAPTPSPSTPAESSIEAILAQIPGQFTFSSGAGGWSTTLDIAPDGSFVGHHHDSDMGDTGPNFPNGTVYQCDFSGHLQVTGQVNEYEYWLVLVDITQDGTTDDETIGTDGVRYIVSYPYGMDNARDFNLYLPGHPVATLPEGYLNWVIPSGALDQSATTLPFWGLYNVGGQQGFSS